MVVSCDLWVFQSRGIDAHGFQVQVHHVNFCWASYRNHLHAWVGLSCFKSNKCRLWHAALQANQDSMQAILRTLIKFCAICGGGGGTATKTQPLHCCRCCRWLVRMLAVSSLCSSHHSSSRSIAHAMQLSRYRILNHVAQTSASVIKCTGANLHGARAHRMHGHGPVSCLHAMTKTGWGSSLLLLLRYALRCAL